MQYLIVRHQGDKVDKFCNLSQYRPLVGCIHMGAL